MLLCGMKVTEYYIISINEKLREHRGFDKFMIIQYIYIYIKLECFVHNYQIGID